MENVPELSNKKCQQLAPYFLTPGSKTDRFSDSVQINIRESSEILKSQIILWIFRVLSRYMPSDLISFVLITRS